MLKKTLRQAALDSLFGGGLVKKAKISEGDAALTSDQISSKKEELGEKWGLDLNKSVDHTKPGPVPKPILWERGLRASG